MNYFEFKKLAYFLQMKLATYVSHEFLYKIYTEINSKKLELTNYADTLVMPKADLISINKFLELIGMIAQLTLSAEVDSNEAMVKFFNIPNDIEVTSSVEGANGCKRVDFRNLRYVNYDAVVKAAIRSRFYRKNFEPKNLYSNYFMVFDFDNRAFNTSYKAFDIEVIYNAIMLISNTIIDNIISTASDIEITNVDDSKIENQKLNFGLGKLKSQLNIDFDYNCTNRELVKFAKYESYNFSHLQNQKIANIILN